MSWTTPRTWVNGEVVTAALMNTHLRDNSLILKTPRNDVGRVTDISSTTFASLSGSNLTGVAFPGSVNTFTAGRTTFRDASRIRVPVGVDKWEGTKGLDAAGVWVEGDYLHHIDQDKTTEWRYLGDLVGTPAGALTGSAWVEGVLLHYVDADGDERTVKFAGSTAVHSDSLAQPGSAWVETYLHFVVEAGTTEQPGHADVTHSDHSDHSDHTDHGDSGAHGDSTPHGDVAHSDSPHVDHTDVGHADVGHGDSHTDHADHSDTGPHTDHADHSDGTPHSDVAADSRPVTV